MTGKMQAPDGWQVVLLGDVATLQRGVDLPIQDRVPGSVPVYGSNGILGTHVQTLHPGPGVITGRSGSIGVVYFSTGPYWPLNTTLYVRDFHGNSERFIYYLLSQLKLERFAASTGVPSLNRNFVHPEPVALPPLPEQQAIAAVLDSIDEAIESAEAVITATERLRDALLHELLTRGVPGWHTQWKDASGIGTIPASWEVVRLGEVATLQRGVDLPVQDRVQGTIPVYGSNGVLGAHAHALHPGPGVVTGRSGSIGAVYFSTGPYWPLNTTLYVRDFHGNSERFIYYLLSRFKLERFAASTGVPSLNRNFVHPEPVVLPPLPEQHAIVAMLDGVDDAIERTREERASLQALKASAADTLLTGRVRVGIY